MLTGFEPYSPPDIGPRRPPKANTALKVSAAFAIASAIVFIRGWGIAYFELTINTPPPTAEELATFRRHALIAVALLSGGLLASVWVGRLGNFGWGKSLRLALLGIPVGLALTVAAIAAFFFVF